MNKKKSLQELTIKDNFMFGAVMLEPKNCKGILERILGIEIERVEVSKEKSIVYNPEYKGVRLDIYARDEKNTHYDVEMQALRKPAIKKRARYYHSQLDMEILLSGLPYRELPDTYVIFLCDFDPFEKGKYKYTQKKICEEIPELTMDDGEHTIFLSTKGRNEDEVSPELVKLLEYVGASLSDSEQDFEHELIKQLQVSVKEVKASREMGARYMTFEEFLDEEREEARKQHLISLVKKKLERGDSTEKIADDLVEELAVIQQVVKELQKE